MTISFWEPQTVVVPGEIRQPTLAGTVVNTQPANAGFESEGTGWTATELWTYPATATAYAGTRVAQFEENPGLGGIGELRSQTEVAVTPGQQLTAKCYTRIRGAYQDDISHFGAIRLEFLDASDQIISAGLPPSSSFWGAISPSYYNIWRELTWTRTAPAGAVKAVIILRANIGLAGQDVQFDNVSWDYAGQTEVASGLLFKAVQTTPGITGASEPTWPSTVGLTVVDNEVTWEAIEYIPDTVTWEAKPILKSGATEPTWPTLPGDNVLDNTISWTAITRRITDSRCPNTKVVAIAASKIFCGDDDIVAYSATVNPLDWSTPEDAGYLPFGLNTYGATPIAALGLYRSNLVIFNSKGYQMWQVDEDPANHAILDASPVGSTYHRSVHPVSNDLVFLTEEGIRNITIAGASTNLQAGFFGKQIDPLVLAALDALTEGEEPIALFWPGAGQYWLFFGSEAFVLTMNGGKSDMSWSRYVFPSDITDWAILDNRLILRSGDKIWEVTEDALNDDETAPGVGTAFAGYVAWPFLDFGGLGREKQMHGFDLVVDGEVAVSVGYSQSNFTLATPDFTVDGDTLSGHLIPMPVTAPSFQFRLTFAGDQESPWEWQATAIYLQDLRSQA